MTGRPRGQQLGRPVPVNVVRLFTGTADARRRSGRSSRAERQSLSSLTSVGLRYPSSWKDWRARTVVSRLPVAFRRATFTWRTGQPAFVISLPESRRAADSSTPKQPSSRRRSCSGRRRRGRLSLTHDGPRPEPIQLDGHPGQPLRQQPSASSNPCRPAQPQRHRPFHFL